MALARARAAAAGTGPAARRPRERRREPRPAEAAAAAAAAGLPHHPPRAPGRTGRGTETALEPGSERTRCASRKPKLALRELPPRRRQLPRRSGSKAPARARGGFGDEQLRKRQGCARQGLQACQEPPRPTGPPGRLSTQRGCVWGRQTCAGSRRATCGATAASAPRQGRRPATRGRSTGTLRGAPGPAGRATAGHSGEQRAPRGSPPPLPPPRTLLPLTPLLRGAPAKQGPVSREEGTLGWRATETRPPHLPRLHRPRPRSARTTPRPPQSKECRRPAKQCHANHQNLPQQPELLLDHDSEKGAGQRRVCGALGGGSAHC